MPPWKTAWRLLEKLETEPPAVSLPGICPERNMVRKGTCTPVFTSAPFIIAKTWKQPKCSSKKEWIKEMWYIYTVEYYSSITKNEIIPLVATWVDLELVIQSKVHQTEK